MDFKRVLFILVVLVLVLLIYNYIQISKFQINNVRLHSDKVTSQVKITQITDFHSNENINLDKLLEDIKGFKPDLILLTGDIIDKGTDDFDLVFKLLEGLKRITENVYFVSGNHETNNRLEDEFYAGLEDLGVSILDNKIERIRINDDSINLLGLPFYANKSDFDSLYDKMSHEEYNLLLSHSPNKPIEYLNEDIDLILSGHTHGGQVRLPIIGSVIAPGQGWFPKYDKGLFSLGDTYLYIDSGLGNSVLPIRMFNRVQLSNIEILSEG